MSRRIFPITMPKWGIEMQQGTIAAWHAGPGANVDKGTPLLDVETDKIVNSVEAPVGGVLRLIVADKGATENVGALIAVMADLSVTDAEIQMFVRNFKPANASFEPEDFPPARQPAAPAGAAPLAPPAPAARESTDAETRISPIARRVAERLGIDPTRIKGTGRDGRVSKEDVEAYAAAQSGGGDSGGGANSDPRRVKLTSMRLAIAKRLVQSKQSIPHYRLAVDADCTALALRRADSDPAHSVSLNDLMIRAAALALIRHPIVNSHLVGDEVLTFAHADICVAVATDGGLVAPVLRGADLKSPAEIGRETRELARRARTGILTRDDIAGGTFTVSNLGMFAVDRFDAIINPPQVAILAVGAVAERVVVRAGSPTVARMATLTLSADHRVVDGAIGAQFLGTLKSLLEEAASL